MIILGSLVVSGPLTLSHTPSILRQKNILIFSKSFPGLCPGPAFAIEENVYVIANVYANVCENVLASAPALYLLKQQS